MKLKSKIRKEGNELSITITGDNGFRAYFKGPNSIELLKNAREMLNIMNIKNSNINLVEEEEERNRNES